MLSQEQYFQAKNFHCLYKDSLNCLNQVSKKRSLFEYQRGFYDRLKISLQNDELRIDLKGNVKRSKNIESGYYFKIYEIVE